MRVHDVYRSIDQLIATYRLWRGHSKYHNLTIKPNFNLPTTGYTPMFGEPTEFDRCTFCIKRDPYFKGQSFVGFPRALRK